MGAGVRSKTAERGVVFVLAEFAIFQAPFAAKRKALSRSGRSRAPVPEQSAIRSEERGTRLIVREGDHPPNGSADIRRLILHEPDCRFWRGRTGTPGEGPCGGENGGRSFPLRSQKSDEVTDLVPYRCLGAAVPAPGGALRPDQPASGRGPGKMMKNIGEISIAPAARPGFREFSTRMAG